MLPMMSKPFPQIRRLSPTTISLFQATSQVVPSHAILRSSLEAPLQRWRTRLLSRRGLPRSCRSSRVRSCPNSNCIYNSPNRMYCWLTDLLVSMLRKSGRSRYAPNCAKSEFRYVFHPPSLSPSSPKTGCSILIGGNALKKRTFSWLQANVSLEHSEQTYLGAGLFINGLTICTNSLCLRLIDRQGNLQQAILSKCEHSATADLLGIHELYEPYQKEQERRERFYRAQLDDWDRFVRTGSVDAFLDHCLF